MIQVKSMSKWFHKRRKALLALAGSVGTWAVTAFPDNHNVQLYAGLALVLVTGTVVHVVPNAKDVPTEEGE
jgi:hypothetical protein